MPIVNLNILEGRDQDAKRALVKNVTNAICESIDVPPEKVRIIINEMKNDDYAVAGTLVVDTLKDGNS